MTRALFLLSLVLLDLIAVVPPQQPVTKHILFVVDVSGSMRGDKFTQACQAVMDVGGQPVDEMFIGVVAFSDQTKRWPGVPDEGVAEGWAKMPSAEALGAAQGFLHGLGAGGDTLVIPALAQALSDPQESLTVVLVSDGIFQREQPDKIIEALKRAQEARKDPAVVICYGVGAEQETLKRIGTEGRGGYLREKPTPVPVIPPDVQGSFR